MSSLLTVIKAMLEILVSQQAQIKALQQEAEMDNQSDLSESDFAGLSAQIEGLSASGITGVGNVPF